MPWSADENRDFLLDHILPSDRVLDVGAGAGIWADLLRAKGLRKMQVDAVEIFEPYIKRFGLEDKYGKIYLGDFAELAIPYNTYNVLILGDVLEHFELADAMKVWDKARKIVGNNGKILLSSPIIDFPQGEEEGNIHEAHLSSFRMNDLIGLPGVHKWQEGDIIGSVVASGETDTLKAYDLTVAITTIPTRIDRLTRAVESVHQQTLQPQDIVISCDTEKIGAPANRDRALEAVKTKYVAFLDDDDYFYPDHLYTLYSAIKETGADIVYSWFDVEGGTDPHPEVFGKPWDPENPAETTITTLCRTEVVRAAGGYTNQHGLDLSALGERAPGNASGEDFRMVYTANLQGAKIVHIPKRTWAYVHWTGNTSGMPTRW